MNIAWDSELQFVAADGGGGGGGDNYDTCVGGGTLG